MIFGYTPQQTAKAIASALISGLGSLALAADDGLTLAEGLGAAAVAATAFGAVFGITNAPGKG